MNSVKTRWIRDILSVTKADFISIQEHFKVTKSLEKYFLDEYPACTSYVIPAQRDKEQDSGRAKGGLAMLCNKNINVKKQRLKSNSFRIQVQVLSLPQTKLLWINTYMPTDPQTIIYDNQDLLNTLADIGHLRF